VSGARWPARYEVRVEGVLGGRWSEWFEGLQIDSQGGETILSGTVPDQSALHGILEMRVEKLMWADLQGRAAMPPGHPGRLKPGAMAKFRRLVGDGNDLFDSVEQLEDQDELTEEAPPQVPGLGEPAAPAAPRAPSVAGGTSGDARLIAELFWLNGGDVVNKKKKTKKRPKGGY
jgi:hypothetical protein